MNKKDARSAQGTKELAAKIASVFLAFALAFTMFGPVSFESAYAGEEAEYSASAEDDGQDLPDEGVVDEPIEPDRENVSSEAEESTEQENATEEDDGIDARAGPGSDTTSDVLAQEPTVQSIVPAESESLAAEADIEPLAIDETSSVVTFYSDTADRNPNIIARLLVTAAPGQTATVDTSAYRAQAPTSEQSFMGWTYNGQTHDGTIEVDPQAGNIDLYPHFATGHWLRFSLAADSSDATAVASLFVSAHDDAPSALQVPSRTGYAFDGWFEGASDGNEIDYGVWIADPDGAVFDPSALKDKLLQRDVVLYAKWTGLPTTYRVFCWYENPDDEGYSYEETLVIGDDEDETAIAGTMTSGASLPSREGFTVQELETRAIAGDGSTVVNAYYDRNIYSVYFHQERVEGSAIFPELTITAKYGANIRDLWPAHDDPNGRYTTSWYTLTDTTSNVFVTSIGTMPLNGDDFYPKLDTGILCETVYRVQAVNGYNTFADYLSVPFTTSNSPWTTPDDYMPIKGFMVNAASEADAKLIRTNDVGDKLATYDDDFTTSAAVEAHYDEAPQTEGSDGQQRHTLYFYYLRCQYDIVFEENGGTPIDDATKIYYEAPLANSAPVSYVEGETTRTAPNGMVYTFAGWYDNEVLTGDKFDFAHETMPAGNVVLYAKWEPARYLVQVDPNGGEFTDAEQSTYFWLEHGQAIGPIEAERHYVADPNGQFGYDYETEQTDTDDFGEADYIAVQEGYEGERYRFSEDAYALFGWYLAGTDEPYDMNAPVTRDTNIVAKWRQAGMFNIAYNPVMQDEGVTVSGDIDVRLDDGYADLSPTFVMNTPDGIEASTGDVYQFVGWQVVSSFDEGARILDDNLYLEGDGFVVDSDMATDNTIHLQAVYEYVSSPEQPATPVTPEGETTPSDVANQISNVATDLDIEQLPKTDDMAKMLPMAISALSLAALGVALIARFMRKRHEETLDDL